MSSLVSVIVPIYNVEEYIDKCVESLVNQTYSILEIILIDDGSSDYSPQKCDEWALKDERIVVIHKNNMGVSYARNTGLDMVNGEYITFVDPDDFLAHNSIEIMLSRIQRDKTDLIVGQFEKVYCDGSQEASEYSWMYDTVIGREEALALVGSKKEPLHCAVWAKLYRREVFSQLRFPSLKMGEDTYLWPHIIENCNKISITSTVVYYYLQRTTSAIHHRTRERRTDAIVSALHVTRFLLERNYVEAAQVYYLSVLCQWFEMKRDKEIAELIRHTFTYKERQLLLSKDIKMFFSLCVYRFPIIKGAYEIIKRLIKLRVESRREK